MQTTTRHICCAAGSIARHILVYCARLRYIGTVLFYGSASAIKAAGPAVLLGPI